VVDYAFG